MSAYKKLWEQLKDKAFREEFVESHLKRSIPFQIRALMNKRGWSQQELATSARLKQGTVTRAANPNYGNLTLNAIIRIAAGFDVAFIGRFVPFSEPDKWSLDLSEESVKSIPTFEEENRGHKGKKQRPRRRQKTTN